MRRPCSEEREWCSERGLDYNILREVAKLAHEIRSRFLKMNVSLESLNSEVDLFDENSVGEMILKTCIGGAFYKNYVKASYKKDEVFYRWKNIRF